MAKETKSKTKVASNLVKVAAVASGLILGGMGGYFSHQPNQITVDKIVYQNQTIEVPVETIVNKTIEVPVDNGNLAEVEQFIYDNQGNINLITSDLKDNEVDQIVDRIVFVNDYKKFAVDAINKDLLYKVDGLTVNSVTIDKRYINTLRINDKLDEISIKNVNFNDKDISFGVTGTFRQDDVAYNYSSDVVFYNGNFDSLKNITVVKQ